MNIKQKPLLSITSSTLLFMIIMASMHVSAATVSSQTTFTIEKNMFAFTIEGSTQDVWDEGKQYQVTANIILENISSSIIDGKITIQLVSFVLTSTSLGDFRRNVVNSGENLLKPGDKTNATYTFDTPTVTQSFHINITVILNWEINGTTSNPVGYSIRLPKEGSIIVKTRNIVPLIELYGFPDKVAFFNWMRVYAFFLSLYAIPVLVIGGFLGVKRILNWRAKKA